MERAFGSMLIFALFMFLGPSLIAESSIGFSDFKQSLLDGIEKVPEFKVIQEEAEKRGLRVWLFGGTAAAYAHYVKWDLLQKTGDPRYQPDRFDFDYTNIFRSTQDLDIAVDGNSEQAQQFQEWLRNRFEYFLGDKNKWEVRSLHEPLGTKYAILGDKNFLNQHTDSHSTGVIEVTKRQAAEIKEERIRDVRDWHSLDPNFLRDAFNSKLHFYFGEQHGQTYRALEGLNPPIFAVIRYLTKVFQYELELEPESEAIIKRIIEDFNAERDLWHPDAQAWVEKNAKKLIQNAVNIEYAWDNLERLGLRKKLIAIKNDADQSESMAWWMSREPLRTKKVGEGNGETAEKLGISILAHETKDYWTYESITRAHTGEANVLSSREAFTAENAVYGDGFYTAIGKEGARGTQYTIHFRLKPEARRGSDFLLIGDEPKEGAYVVVLNRAAIEVVPESLNFGLYDFFASVASGLEFDQNNKAILEKVKRRLKNRFTASLIPADEIQKTFELVRNGRNTKPVLYDLWKSFDVSTQFPEIFSGFHLPSASLTKDHAHEIIRAFNANLNWAKTDWARTFLEQMPIIKDAAVPSEAFTIALLNQLKPFESEHDADLFLKFYNRYIKSNDPSSLLKMPKYLRGIFENSTHKISQVLRDELLGLLIRSSDQYGFVSDFLTPLLLSGKVEDEVVFDRALEFLLKSERGREVLSRFMQAPKTLSQLMRRQDDFAKRFKSKLIELFEESHLNLFLNAIAVNFEFLRRFFPELGVYLEQKVDQLSRDPAQHRFLVEFLLPILPASLKSKRRVMEYGFSVDPEMSEYPIKWSFDHADEIEFLLEKKAEVDSLPETFAAEWKWILIRRKEYKTVVGKTSEYSSGEAELPLARIPETWLRKKFVTYQKSATLQSHLRNALWALASHDVDQYLKVFGTKGLDMGFDWDHQSVEVRVKTRRNSNRKNSPIFNRIERLLGTVSRQESLSNSDLKLLELIIEEGEPWSGWYHSFSLLPYLIVHSEEAKTLILERIRRRDLKAQKLAFSLLDAESKASSNKQADRVFEWRKPAKQWLLSELRKDSDLRAFLRDRALNNQALGTVYIQYFPWDLSQSEDALALLELRKYQDELAEHTERLRTLEGDAGAEGVSHGGWETYSPSFDEPRELSQKLNQEMRRHLMVRNELKQLLPRLKIESGDAYDRVFGSCSGLLRILNLKPAPPT